MKLLSKALLTGLALSTALSTNASADDHEGNKNEDKWITSLRLGMTDSFQQDLTFGVQGIDYRTVNDLGSLIGLNVARDIGRWRLSADFDIRSNDVEALLIQQNTGLNVPLGEIASDGLTQSQSLMVNAAYAIVKSGDWKWFVGAGAGFANLEHNDISVNGDIWLQDSQVHVAYQGFTEAVYDINNDWEFAIGGRYWAAPKHRFRTAQGVDGVVFGALDAFVRLGYKFGHSKPTAKPAKAIAPVAKPAPAPAPKKPTIAPVKKDPAPKKAAPKPLPAKPYIVYFDFASAELTRDARKIVRDAARAYGDYVRIELAVSGHTDRAGATGYNDLLAERRTTAVRNALLEAGVKSTDIQSSSYGESQNAVSTDDGVREGKNRRVEIVFRRK